jgi:hypothetical protein
LDSNNQNNFVEIGRDSAGESPSINSPVTTSSGSQPFERKLSASSSKGPKSMIILSNSSLEQVSDISHKRSLCNEILSNLSTTSSSNPSSRKDLQSCISQSLLQSSHSQVNPNVFDSSGFFSQNISDGVIKDCSSNNSEVEFQIKPHTDNNHQLLINYENIKNVSEEKEEKEESFNEFECLEENENEMAFRIRKRARLNKKDKNGSKEMKETEDIVIRISSEEVEKEKVEDVLEHSGEKNTLNVNNSYEKEEQLTESSQGLLLSSDFSSHSKNSHLKLKKLLDNSDEDLREGKCYGLSDGPSILNESLLGQPKNARINISTIFENNVVGKHRKQKSSLDSIFLESSVGPSEYDNLTNQGNHLFKGHVYKKSDSSLFLLADSTTFRHPSRSSLGLSTGVDTYTAGGLLSPNGLNETVEELQAVAEFCETYFSGEEKFKKKLFFFLKSFFLVGLIS